MTATSTGTDSPSAMESPIVFQEIVWPQYNQNSAILVTDPTESPF
jgi:hypothetical protein